MQVINIIDYLILSKLNNKFNILFFVVIAMVYDRCMIEYNLTTIVNSRIDNLFLPCYVNYTVLILIQVK